MNILVTGATGFLGHALITHLLQSEHVVTASVREFSLIIPDEVNQIVTGDLATLDDVTYENGKEVQLRQAKPTSTPEDEAFTNKESFCEQQAGEVKKIKTVLQQMDVVVHTAACLHKMNDKSSNLLAEFRRVNTEATLSLANKAAMAGVRRFIFLSTVKVHGELTSSGEVFSENGTCAPTDPYGISKWEAEQGLMQIAKETGMEVVIIRPPLIYGPGVKGNFADMMKWVKKAVPLPLGVVKNKRSLLALDNLVSFIADCLEHPKAANQCFLLSDGEDVSLTELIQKLASVHGKEARLVPVPVSWMRFAVCLLGKQEVAARLFGSLQVDSSKAKDLLGWQPVITMDEQLKKMVD